MSRTTKSAATTATKSSSTKNQAAKKPQPPQAGAKLQPFEGAKIEDGAYLQIVTAAPTTGYYDAKSGKVILSDGSEVTPLQYQEIKRDELTPEAHQEILVEQEKRQLKKTIGMDTLTKTRRNENIHEQNWELQARLAQQKNQQPIVQNEQQKNPEAFKGIQSSAEV